MFEVAGVKPGVETIVRLARASFADQTVVLTIFSTLAIDMLPEPLELAIAKFREVMAEESEPNEHEMSLAQELERMTFADAQAVNFDASKIIQKRLGRIKTNPIGQCRVYVDAKELTRWTLKMDVHDQRARIFSASHNLVVYRAGYQHIGSQGGRVGF